MHKDHRSPLIVSGIIFALMAIVHLLRILQGWSLVIGTFTVPLWGSWIGLIIAILLAIWMFNSAGCEKCNRTDEILIDEKKNKLE